MHNSPFSVMGDGNVQNTNVHKIIAAIENSKASETEKKEARSLFDQIFRNKLLWSAIATLLPAGPAN